MYTACKSIIITSLFLATSLQGSYHPELISHNSHLKQLSDNLVIDLFQNDILDLISSSYPIEAFLDPIKASFHPIETFLYFLAIKDPEIVSKWRKLRKLSQRSFKECFQLICNHILPLPGTFYFSHFPENYNIDPVYPLIIEHASPLYKFFSTQYPHLMGPPMTTYSFATAVKKCPDLLLALLDLGHAKVPRNFENINTSMRTRIIPRMPLNIIQFFSTRDLRKYWKKNILQTNAYKLLFFLNMKKRLMHKKHIPEHILRNIYQCLPRVMQMQQF